MDSQHGRFSIPRIFLADDHEIVLEGLQALLKEKYPVVGFTSQGDEVMELVRGLKPECVLLDITLGETSGFDLVRELKHELPQMKVIFVTMHTEPTFVKEAFLLGVDGYILKHSAATELFEAIDQIMGHHRYISTHLPEAVREIADIAAEGMPTEEYSGHLTERQQNVLSLLAKGYSSKKIGKRLGISQSTVAFHKTNIARALGLQKPADLTKYALSEGFVSLDTGR